MNYCSGCGAEVGGDYNYCRECGLELDIYFSAPQAPEAYCTGCGTEVSREQPFCAECGTELDVESSSTVEEGDDEEVVSSTVEEGDDEEEDSKPKSPDTGSDQWYVSEAETELGDAPIIMKILPVFLIGIALFLFIGVRFPIIQAIGQFAFSAFYLGEIRTDSTEVSKYVSGFSERKYLILGILVLVTLGLASLIVTPYYISKRNKAIENS